MKKNAILITSNFLPNPSANGVCAYNLARILVERGYSLDIISNREYRQKKNESIDGIQIHRVYSQYFIHFIKNRKIQTIYLRVNLLFHIFMFPLVSILAIFRYVYITIKLIKQNGSGLLITLNNPLIGCIAGVIAKKVFKSKLRFVIYDVDSFSNTLKGRYLSLSRKRKMMWKWEKAVFRAADLAIVMRNHEAYYNQEKYSQFMHKMRIANFPMLYTHFSETDNKTTGNRKIECVYLGSLSQNYRNPKIICEVFSRISNINLKFFGKIDNAKSIIAEFSRKTKGRLQHAGMVTFLEGQSILKNAEILISIGNRDSDMVPSKTFEYMSYCKPIIHFYTFNEDPVIPILSQYPIALLLDANGSIQTLAEKVNDFLSASTGKAVDSKMVRELLYENTPEYSIDLIEYSVDP